MSDKDTKGLFLGLKDLDIDVKDYYGEIDQLIEEDDARAAVKDLYQKIYDKADSQEINKMIKQIEDEHGILIRPWSPEREEQIELALKVFGDEIGEYVHFQDGDAVIKGVERCDCNILNYTPGDPEIKWIVELDGEEAELPINVPEDFGKEELAESDNKATEEIQAAVEEIQQKVAEGADPQEINDMVKKLEDKYGAELKPWPPEREEQIQKAFEAFRIGVGDPIPFENGEGILKGVERYECNAFTYSPCDPEIKLIIEFDGKVFDLPFHVPENADEDLDEDE